MSLIVEDGTGKADANGYISVSELQTYWTNRGVDLTGYTDSVLGTWIILATEYIDNTYCFYGDEYTDTQALRFPRDAFTDSRGREIEAATVPTALKNATASLAYASQGTILETSVDSSITSKSVGSVSVSYGSGSRKIAYTQADNQIKQIGYLPGEYLTRG